MDKSANAEKLYEQLLLDKEDSNHVECRYRIIDRLFSIEVLGKSFHPNTLIKGEL